MMMMMMMMMIFAHSQFDNTLIFTLVPQTTVKTPKTRVNNTRLDEGFLYLIVPFWYALAAYQVSLVEPWFHGETKRAQMLPKIR